MGSFFLDIWLFITSQLGLVAVGLLAGVWLGSAIKRELRNVIDRIDGRRHSDER